MLSSLTNSLRRLRTVTTTVIQIRKGTTIPVILTQNLENKGRIGDVILVKRGFARNFLIPKRIAVYATKENREHYLFIRNESTVTSNVQSKNLEKLKNYNMKLERNASVTGSLYGSVTVTDIMEVLANDGITNVNVELDSPIKTIGHHAITVNGVSVTVDVRAAQTQQM